jgi:hypothetical protein
MEPIAVRLAPTMTISDMEPSGMDDESARGRLDADYARPVALRQLRAAA